MKHYIKRALFCSDKPKNACDRAIKKFLECDVVDVKVGDYHTKAINWKGESLRWWSANKYYSYGHEMRVEDTNFETHYIHGYPSIYYKNLLANIEKGNLTKKKEKVTLYKCKDNKHHNLFLFKGCIWCYECKKFYESYELTKPKGVFE